MINVDREEFYRSSDETKTLITGIHNRLDRLNGRTRRLEVKVAIMWALWAMSGTAGAIILPIIISHFIHAKP